MVESEKKIEIEIEEKVREDDCECFVGVVRENGEVIESFECDVIENDSEEEFLKRMRKILMEEK
jgi:hypothetical protein